MPSLTLEQAYELAVRHHTSGRPGEAESLYRQILTLNPSHAGALSMLGVLLGQSGRLQEGLQLARQATSLDPSNFNACGNLAVMLGQSGRLDEAIETYRKVLTLRPDTFEAHNNLGNALRAAGRFQEAVDAYRQALSVMPNSGEIRWNLGVVLLQLGNFQEGWREHEGRLTARGFPMHASFGQAPWDGSDLHGRRILLHAEQGLGDTIQFVRYVPLVKARGGRVIVRCPSTLVRLLKSVEGAEQVVGDDQPIPQFDEHCPLMSLPLRFGTTLENVPAEVPYLRPPAELTQHWKNRVAMLPLFSLPRYPGGGLGRGLEREWPQTPTLTLPRSTGRGDKSEPATLSRITSSSAKKVGLVWGGNPRYVHDRARSIGLARLAPLAEIADVTFVSLQKGEPAAQANSPPPGMNLVNWSQELGDFADTAALICQLNLIICVDTAVAHLAGALGKPTWLLLAEPAEWRWMLKRNDSPWYPTMRLYRQPRPGDWETVVRDVAAALATWRPI
jgi:lipoprotein NlpI